MPHLADQNPLMPFKRAKIPHEEIISTADLTVIWAKLFERFHLPGTIDGAGLTHVELQLYTEVRDEIFARLKRCRESQ